MKPTVPSITLVLTLLLTLFAHAQQTGTAASPATPAARFYAKMAEATQGPDVRRTATVGAPTGVEYAELPPAGGVLVGFDLWKGNFRRFLVVSGIRPIFQTATGRVRGKTYGSEGGNLTTVEAKDGFAVAGIEVKGGERVDQLRVAFMKINYTGFNLDSVGAYKTEWIGGSGGGREQRLIPNQKPVVGIFGGSGRDLDRLGLIYLDLK